VLALLDNKKGVQMEKNKEQELLKSVADVLDEALAVYDELQKADSFSNIENVDDMKGSGPSIVGEGTGPKPAMAKEDDMKPNPFAGKEKEEGEEEEDEDSDDKLEEAYKSLCAKMEKRGLMQKTVQKSETAPKADDLRKSVDERFENLNKAIKEVSETVKKIASQPTQRKGVTGQSPLKKSEDAAEPLKKSEVIEKLMDLRKSGDKRVDSLFVNRIETNRHSAADVQTLRALNILK
jgi:replicative superfamily II helicase